MSTTVNDLEQLHNDNKIKGYLINLKKRKDRLTMFKLKNAPLLSDINLEVIEAVDGKSLDIDTLCYRINLWNLRNLQDNVLRGVVGCCMSHLYVYYRIVTGQDEYAIVFEDDAKMIKLDNAIKTSNQVKSDKHLVNFKISNLLKEIPEDQLSSFGIMWLNDWEFIKNSNHNIKPHNPNKTNKDSNNNNKDSNVNIRKYNPLSRTPTTEAYIISKKFANILYDEIINDMGAIDAHIHQIILKHPEFSHYESCPPLFKQANRLDSDIRT